MNKDRFDALVKLADFHREVRQARRVTEWRVTMAAWALIIASAVSLRPAPCVYFVLATIVCVFESLWVSWNFRTSERDSLAAYKYLGEAKQLLGLDPDPERPRKLREHWPSLSQIVVSFVLALLGTAFVFLGLEIRAPIFGR